MTTPRRNQRSTGFCEWFLMCVNQATTTEPHPILGNVPICARCQTKVHAIRDAGRRGGETE